MAKIDEIKEFIGFLKAIFITFVIIDTSLLAWIFKNFNIETSLKLTLVNIAILVCSAITAYLFAKILKEIKRLKDL